MEVLGIIGRDNVDCAHLGLVVISNKKSRIMFVETPPVDTQSESIDMEHSSRLSEWLHGIRYQKLYMLDLVDEYWLKRFLASYRITHEEHAEYFLKGQDRLIKQLPEPYFKRWIECPRKSIYLTT